MADSKKDIGETTHSIEFHNEGDSSSSKFNSDSKSVSVSVSVSDSDDDPIPAYKKKKLQKPTANSSSAAATDVFRTNVTLMSDYDIKGAILRTNRVISSANNLPDKGLKLKNYVNCLEQNLKARIIRRSLQDASGSKRPVNSVAASVIDTKSLIRVCPSGCYDKDQAWEEKGHMGISHIFVYSENGYICGLQFQYVENGKLVLSQTYGQNAGLNFKLVTFLGISEYIIGVTGTFGYFGIGKTRAVKSLTIETNRRLYELNGRPENGETKFSYQFGPTNQFGGFHGTFSRGPSAMLTSIGVYVNTAIDLDVFLSPFA